MSNMYFTVNGKGGVSKTENAATVYKTLDEMGRSPTAADIDNVTRLTTILGEDKIGLTISPGKNTEEATQNGDVEALRATFDPLATLLEDAEGDIVVDVGANIPQGLAAWCKAADFGDLLSIYGFKPVFVVSTKIDSVSIAEGAKTMHAFHDVFGDQAEYVLVVNRLHEGSKMSLEEFISGEGDSLEKAYKALKKKVDFQILDIACADPVVVKLAQSTGFSLVGVARGIERAFDAVRPGNGAKPALPPKNSPEGQLLIKAGFVDEADYESTKVTKVIVSLSRLADRLKVWRANTREEFKKIIPAEQEAAPESQPEAAE